MKKREIFDSILEDVFLIIGVGLIFGSLLCTLPKGIGNLSFGLGLCVCYLWYKNGGEY